MSAVCKIPPLRFKGFEGAWEEKRLGEMGSPYNGLSGKCKSDFGHGDGRYVTYLNVFNNPVVGAEGCDRIEVDKSQNEVCDGDVFFTTSSETPEEVGMASVWNGDGDNTYLNSFCFGYRPKSKIKIDFWAYMLRADSFRGRIVVLAQGISRYNISKVKVMELPVSLPKGAEQLKIGSTFRSLEALVADRDSAVEKLQTLKKAMLEKMFPRAGAKVPEVRFKGCEGEWERKPLDEIAKKRNESALSGGVPKLEYEDIVSFEGVLKRSLDHLYIEKRGISFYVGDVLFGKLRPYLGNWFHATFDGVAVGDWWVLKPVSVVSEYLYVLIQSDAFQVAANQSAGSKMPRADWNLVSETLYPIPPTVEEQRKIGAYFRSLDALISARQEEVGKLKNLKKALLDRMFV